MSRVKRTVEEIHTAPRDDAPRLAYTDWLGAHAARDYVEFIRLQCQTPYNLRSDSLWRAASG
jgi:uncharacterized protein (TIGR02996 family)